MIHKIKRILFLLILSTSSFGAHSQYETGNKNTWPDLENHSAYHYKRYPCGFNAMYYLLQRLDRMAQLNDDDKETLLKIPDIATFNHLREISGKIGVTLEGFQVTYSEINDFSLMMTILDDEQYQENHYVVIEKIDDSDRWLVTDWPNARYTLTSSELQKITNGFVLVPVESVAESIPGPILVVDRNPINVGDHEKDEVFNLRYKVFNYGTKPLTIDAINSTCQCTIPNLNQKSIMPGQSELFTVEVTTSEKTGEWNEFITLKCNDTYLPSPVITVSGNSKPLWEISKEKIAFRYTTLFDIREKQIELTIKFNTKKELHPDDFMIEILSDTFFQYQINSQLLAMKRSGLTKSFKYMFTLNTDMLVPLLVDGVVIIQHKTKPDIDIRIPLFIHPPKDFRIYPQPATLTLNQPASIELQAGAIDLGNTKIISDLDFVTVSNVSTTNQTNNMTITIYKDYKESFLPLTLINGDRKATIGIPVFSSTLF